MSVRASRASKRDRNEPAIISLLHRLGAQVIQLEPGQGADLIVIAENGIHICEVKNPAYKWELTQDESLMKMRVERVGQQYHILQTVEDAARLLGREVVDWQAALERDEAGR
jgi:hypothetical protein